MTIDLLALPCAGASATMYWRWRNRLPASVKLRPVELPGRGMRMAQPYIEDYAEVVNLLCRECSEQMRGEYILFGHSMGALLAYGMTLRQSQHKARMPKALIISASSAPSARDTTRFANKNSDAELMADLRDQGGTPQAVFDSPELLRMTLDTLRADYRICQSFTYLPTVEALNIPLYVLAGRDDDIAQQSIEAWCKEAKNHFAVHWFDGGHFFIWQQEKQVLDCINRLLASLQIR